MNENFHNKGLIGRILLILVAIFIVASYFSIDLESTVKAFSSSPVTTKNFEYVVGIGKSVWSGYLEQPTKYFWNNVVSNLIKDAMAQNLKNLKALKEGDYDSLKLTPAFPQNLVPTVGGCADGYC